ncbi:MAG: PspC domain-containing protein [Ruminococcus sp.]|nr:PspC domain-containing protein [Ruminococcus sp.]
MKKLYKINEGKVIKGVCNGISEYLNVDVGVVRLVCIFLSFLSVGATLGLYCAAIILLPTKNFRDD